LIPAGESIKTPLPLLTSSDFEKLMEELVSEFDLVVVDTPPVGVVIDAAEIAKRCDGSLLVLEYNKQTKGTLRYMKRIMEQTQTPIIGCVINKLVMKKLTQKRYYYQYSGNYHYYSDKTNEKKKSGPRSKGRKK
jgi:capsular exopolysaccharide synthesis family protein